MKTQTSVSSLVKDIEANNLPQKLDELELEKQTLKDTKKKYEEQYQKEKVIAESELKEVEAQIQEEEQALALIQACLEGVKRRNASKKTSTEMPEQDHLNSPDFHYGEEKTSSHILENNDFTTHERPQTQTQYQQPWFRRVKRRIMTDEYHSMSSNREYKSATEILYEKEQEWTEISYS